MATKPSGADELLSALAVTAWDEVLEAVSRAERWLRDAAPGDRSAALIVAQLAALADHSKWEVRRAVANVAARTSHPGFESALSRLLLDDNARVRQAAERASIRRRDWQTASSLGRQHEERLNTVLDDVEARFGIRGRDAVKRASEQIANTFARELYHEVIKLLSPLAVSAERLQDQLSNPNIDRPELAKETQRIGRRVGQLRAVLDAMRAYTEVPRLAFQSEVVSDVVSEAVGLVRDAAPAGQRLKVLVHGAVHVTAEVSRPRLVQALTNVVSNAVESYEDGDAIRTVDVRVEAADGRVDISIEDRGGGMTAEALADATVLFSTSKPNGTGFGLPLAVKIIESEHGGRLTLESAPGRGTTVRIALPIVAPRARP